MIRQSHCPSSLLMSRRGLLLGGAAAVVAASGVLPGATFAASADAVALRARFMQLSSLLVNHTLSPDVGARILATASADHADLPDMMNKLIAVAESKQAKAVEDFFGDVPTGPLKDFAHWVISAWYSGCSSAKADAKVFTYEEALTFKTTSDVVTIPSYGFTGPDRWSQVTVPLAAMPRF